MTSPILINQPTFGEILNQATAPLLQTLRFNQQRQQEQQKIDIEQQNAQTQQLSERARARAETSNQVMGLMDKLGPDVIDDPSVQSLMEQTGVNPRSISQQYKVKQKAQADADESFIQSLPDYVQPGQRAAIGLIRRGGGLSQAQDLAAIINSNNIKPDQLASIDAEFPELKGLPVPQKLTAVTNIRVQQMQARAGVGPEALRAAQLAETKARTNLINLQALVEKAKNPSDRTNVVLQYLREVDQQTNFQTVAITHPELIGKSKRDQVKAIFGPRGLKGYDDALTFMQSAIPNNPNNPLPDQQP